MTVQVSVSDGGTVVYDSSTDNSLISVKVTKTTFFSADTFEFTVDNSDFVFNNTFEPYQEVQIFISDIKMITGRIKTIKFEQTANKRIIKISGQDYSDLLMKIHATEEYLNSNSPCTAEGCELSEIVKDLMQKYAQGKIGYNTYVYPTNKRYATNSGDSIQFKQVPVWDIIKNLAQAAAFVAYVDEDKELHFEPRNTTSSGVTLSSVSPQNGNENTYEMNKFDKVIDGDKILTRIIVYGDSSVPIIKQADSLAKQEKYGIIEEIYQDNSITDAAWAKDIAVERVKLFSIERETYTAETKNFVYAKVGQLIRVINPDYDLDTEMVIHSIEYDIKHDKISTKFVLNSYPESYIDFIKKLSEEIKRLKAQNTTTGVIDKIIQFYEEFSIADNPNFSTYQHINTEGLILYLKFDEGSGNIAYDSSGYGNHGTIYGSGYAWTSGQFGGCLNITVSNGSTYIKTNFANGQSFQIKTVSFRFKTTGGTTIVSTSADKSVGTADQINIGTFAGKLRFTVREAGVNTVRDSLRNDLQDGNWHSAVVIFSDTGWTMVIDGQVDNSGSDTFNLLDQTAYAVWCGMGAGQGCDSATGYVDEVRLFTRALTIEEAQALCNSPGGFYVWGDDTVDVGVGEGGAASPDTTFKWNFGQWE